MKKLIYGSLLLVLAAAGVTSCKKDTINEKSKSSVSSPQLRSSTLYRVGNGMLIFNTVDDFDKVIQLSTDAYNQSLRDLSYVSYAESLTSGQVNTVEDEFLSAALSRDQAIQIQNFIYHLNKPNGRVFAIHKDKYSHYADLISENTSNSNVLSFSVDENVFELLGEVVDNEKALSSNCQSSMQNTNGGWTQYADYVDVQNVYGNGSDKRYKFSVWLRVRYDNWGFYRKLFTEFKHKESWGGTFNETYASIAHQVNYYIKNGGSGNVTQYPSFPFASSSSYNGTSGYEYYTQNKEIQHYRGTKCLKAFVLKSWTWYRNRQHLTPRLYPSNGCLRIEAGGLSNVYGC